MANLKEIRYRITSIGTTMQITSAMKMVSAAKLKRATDAIVQMRPYSEKLTSILENISSSIDGNESIYTRDGGERYILIIPITSNRGLCGAFNSNIIKRTNSLINEKYAGKQVTVMSIGKKATDYFKNTDYAIRGTFLPRDMDEVFDNMSFENVSSIAEKVMAAFEHNDFDRVILVYNKFINAASQDITTEQFLPLLPSEDNASTVAHTDHIFEPNKEEIVRELLPLSLKTQFYKALLDSVASEHGARMTAMHKATDNASEMKEDLTLQYNKARQAAITNEILEIVGGAEALKS
ncbi:MAG: ATP synthase F1 subunit gamma [Flavobacteriales bacterium]|nr:ATP synthase F1 subunit gamma [Flavobacteriales bacterium]